MRFADRSGRPRARTQAACQLIAVALQLSRLCLFVAGAGWSTLPAQILVQAGELQRNALDNCAAACACRSWRSAVNGSCIQSLQLHACTSSTKADQWGAVPGSRAAINQIQLTAASPSNAQMQQAASSSLRNIPLDCQTLSADGPFAAVIHDYTDQAAKLQQLFLDCQSCFMTRTTSSSFQTLPMLTHLVQLKTLHLRATTINYVDAIASSVLSHCKSWFFSEQRAAGQALQLRHV